MSHLPNLEIDASWPLSLAFYAQVCIFPFMATLGQTHNCISFLVHMTKYLSEVV